MKQILRLTAGGIALTGLLALAPRTTEATSSSTTYLTFSGPVALPGVTLAAGTYTFDLPAMDLSLVRVSSRDGSRVLFTAFTHVVDRPANIAPNQHVSLGEAPRGEPRAITTWYLPGRGRNLSGREFIYRK